jgi:hypothetical protein
LPGISIGVADIGPLPGISIGVADVGPLPGISIGVAPTNPPGLICGRLDCAKAEVTVKTEVTSMLISKHGVRTFIATSIRGCLKSKE